MLKNVSPGLQVLAFIFLVIFMGVFGSIIFQISLGFVLDQEQMDGLNYTDPRWRLAITFFGQVFSFLMAFLVFLRLSGESFKDIVLMQPIKVKYIFITIVVFILSYLLLPVFELINEPLKYILPSGMIESEALANKAMSKLILNKDPTQFVFTLIVMAAAPAIFEELIFRGFLIKKMIASGMKENGAILMSGAIFAISHNQPLKIVSMFLLGACLGYVYVKFKNLKYSILLHFLFNSIQITIGYLVAKGILDIQF